MTRVQPGPEAANLAPNAGALWGGALAEELHRCGVSDAVLCPGSRSAPLALAVARGAIRPHVLLDERSAGYFGVGMAKAQANPVVIVTTSGTAAANLLPAVVEADQAHVPLVVVTADRPPELRDVGANQSIRQDGLFGRAVRWACDLPVPEVSSAGLRHLRQVACRAVAFARLHAGPVHLNVPFREPSAPIPVPDDLARMEALAITDPQALWGRPAGPPWTIFEAATGEDGAPGIEQPLASSSLANASVGLLDRTLAAATTTRVVVVAGAGSPPSLSQWAALLQAPLLADVQSHAFGAANALRGFDAFLASRRLRAALRPDLVIQAGAAPTSRHLRTFLEDHRDVPRIVVGHGMKLWDELESASVFIASPAASCQALAPVIAAAAVPPPDGGAPSRRRSPTAWLECWQAAARTTAGLEPREPDWEGTVPAALASVLWSPDAGQSGQADGTGESAAAFIWVGSSLPIRDLDRFWPGAAAGAGRDVGAHRGTTHRGITIRANRGASGIDGVLSSAAGAACAEALAAQSRGRRPPRSIAYVGDLTFLHDLNGLAAIRRHAPHLAVVVLNNGGGRIFEHLPVAEAVPRPEFEGLFLTPQDVDIGLAAAAFGLPHVRLAGTSGLGAALASNEGGVVELVVDGAVAARRRKAHLGAVVDAMDALAARLEHDAEATWPAQEV